MTLCRSFGYSKQAYYRAVERKRGTCRQGRAFPAVGAPRTVGKTPQTAGSDDGFEGLAPAVPELGEGLGGIPPEPGLGERHHLCGDPFRLCLPVLGDGCLFPAHHGLVHHSDRGCQYCSEQYVSTLSHRGIKISMTQDGSPYDNAIAERVNGILKQEWLDGEHFANVQEVRDKVEEVVGLYNTKRPHMAIGFNTPETVYAKKIKGYEWRIY